MRCPMAGLEKAVARTAQAYRQADAADNFEVGLITSLSWMAWTLLLSVNYVTLS